MAAGVLFHARATAELMAVRLDVIVMSMSVTTFSHLAPKPGSLYRQLFVKNTRIAARILYGMFVNEEEPRSPEDIASAFRLPVEAVYEAIRYCESNPPALREDWEREEAHIRARMYPTRRV